MKFISKIIDKSKNAFTLWKEHGFQYLLYILTVKMGKMLEKKNAQNKIDTSSAKYLIEQQFPHIQPIKHLSVQNRPPIINLVTDSLSKESLFGGDATSVIIATLFSKKIDAPLRIITRNTPANPNAFFNFLKLMQIEPPKKMDFFSDSSRHLDQKPYLLDTSPNDIFIATSWWSALAIDQINLRKNFFYILQEVEAFIYPNSDEQVMSQRPLVNPKIRFLINSQLLGNYYSAHGPKEMMQHSYCFEPAFPTHLFSPSKESFQKKRKHSLFFYARPNQPRNLFYTGLKLIDQAAESGLLNKDEWQIYFGGAETPKITFPNGMQPIHLKQMNWKDYAQFCPQVDLGICLMNTPHPSYPPLDIAASGGVVLTNQFESKSSLPYSNNILCSDINPDKLFETLKCAIELAKDPLQREKNFKANQIARNWEQSLEKTLQFMVDAL